MIEKDEVAPWPEDDLEGVPNCPVCGGCDRELLHQDLTDRVFRVAPGVWTLYRCCGCRSAWLDPRPTPRSIGRAYASYYTHDDHDHPIVRRRGVIRRFLHDAINGYMNSRYRVQREPALSLGRWLIPLLPSLKTAVDADFRHLSLPPIGGGMLLDVGCGNGRFLKNAKEMGWQVEGIDLDPQAVETAAKRGLNVRCGGVELLADVRDIYDVITLSHVIEHVYDPDNLLRSLYRLLKPGGRLWLETPNMESLGYKRYGASWRDLDPPRHLMLFSAKSLTAMLKQLGFSKIESRRHGLVVFQIYAASEAIAENRNALIVSRDAKPPFTDIFAEVIESIDQRKHEFITLLCDKPKR